MTFWWSEDNYGQILQCYALQKYLQDAGHDAYVIKYNNSSDYTIPLINKIFMMLNPRLVYNAFSYRIRKKKMRKEEEEHPRKFDQFRYKYIKWSSKEYSTYKELYKNPPVADIYIVGSDQVWNFFHLPVYRTKNSIEAYLLNFGAGRVVKMAYAPSFGANQIRKSHLERMKVLLENFRYISVREQSGIALCQQCSRNDAELVPDPTLLLDVNVYRSLYSDKIDNKTEKKYCLLYLLGTKTDFSNDRLYKWAKEKKLEIKYISSQYQYDNYEKIYATIPEWIYLIDKAEYVITNSFHGTVFSLLFEKKFGYIPLSGKASDLNERVLSLFQILGVQDHFVGENINIVDNYIDYGDVSLRLTKFKRSNKFLDAIMSVKIKRERE